MNMQDLNPGVLTILANKREETQCGRKQLSANMLLVEIELLFVSFAQ